MCIVHEILPSIIKLENVMKTYFGLYKTTRIAFPNVASKKLTCQGKMIIIDKVWMTLRPRFHILGSLCVVVARLGLCKGCIYGSVTGSVYCLFHLKRLWRFIVIIFKVDAIANCLRFQTYHSWHSSLKSLSQYILIRKWT